MNKAYRLIWNELTRTWVAVAEIARARGKRASGAVLLTAASSLAFAAAPAPDQLPTGGQIVGGAASGSIATSGSSMTITQYVPRMIANWDSFNIGANAGVQFVQPSSSAIALNRVLSQDPTQILGRLSANGQVMLVNPAGIVFGVGSQVNTGALVASTLAITDADFTAGKYAFANSGLAGSVLNQGRIVTPSGGVVALIAPVVKNEGSIGTPKGSTLMAAADKVTIDFAGDGLIRYSLDAGAAGALVANNGSVAADGGVAVLSAKAADAVTRSVVNNSGLIRASSLTAKGGRIVLEGDDITLAAGSTLDASGAIGGGTVLVGGDWQGSGDMRQATAVTMEAGASIDARATRDGDGGKVVLWSNVSDTDSLTRVDGSILAAGAGGGKGGAIETSGHHLGVAGTVNAGQGGTWLLDPIDLTITSSGTYSVAAGGGTAAPATNNATVLNTSINAALNAGNSVILQTAGGTGGSGNITVAADIAKTSGAASSLTLQADAGIFVNAGVAVTDSAASALSLNLQAAGPIRFADNAASTNSVNIHGALYMGGKAGSLSYATGNSTYREGIYIGNNTALAAGSMTLYGKGVDGSAGSTGTYNSGQAGGNGGAGTAGGAGFKLGGGASLTATGAVAITGIGGIGGDGGAGATGGVSGGAGLNGGTGAPGSDGGSGVDAADTAAITGASVALNGTGGVGGKGGAGGNGGNGTSSSSYNGGNGGAGAIGGTGGRGLVIGAASISATAGSLTNVGTGGMGGRGGRGGNGGNASNNTNLGTATSGAPAGNGGMGGTGGSGVTLNASILAAINGIDQTATGGDGGIGGDGGTGGRGGDTKAGSGAGNGGRGGNAGQGGNSGIGASLGSGVTLASDTGTIRLDDASGTAGNAGSAGAGGGGGHDQYIFGWRWASSGPGGSGNTAGTKAAAFVAAGTGYIGAANGGSSSADITLISDNLSLASLAFSSSGALNIQTKTAATLIDLGIYTANATHLQLGQSAFWNGTAGNFKNGFSSITIGSATQKGAIAVNGLTYTDALVLQAATDTGGVTGSVTLSGAMTDLAGAGNDGGLTVKAARDIVMNANASIVSHGRSVVLNADSDAAGGGAILMNSGSSIATDGGNITLGGGANPAATAATGNATYVNGIKLISSTLDAGSGNISLRGVGASGVAGTSGVYLSGSSLRTTSGSIDVTGTGSGNGAANYGVFLFGSTVQTTGGGNLTLTGQGSLAGTLANNEGVKLENNGVGSLVEVQTGSGTLTINGKGGSGTSYNIGVNVRGASTVRLGSAATGSMLVNGTGGSCTTTGCWGVLVEAGSAYESLGAGSITLIGTGGTGGDNIGIKATQALTNRIGSASMTGDITLIADTLALKPSGTESVTVQTQGRLIIQPKSVGTTIGLAGGAGTLQLPTSYFTTNFANYSGISIGRSDGTGAMTLGGALDWTGKNANLYAGSITDGNTTNRIITAGTLNLLANGGAIGGTLNNAIDFVAPNLSVNTTGNGSAYLTSTAGFDLGASNIGSGTLSLVTTGSGGGVTQSGAVTAGTMAATLAGANSQLNLGTRTNAISNLAGITAGGGFSLTNGNIATTMSGNITTSAGNGAVSINTGAIIQNTDVDISAGSGAITLAANSLSVAANTGNNAFNTSGALTLKTYTPSFGIVIGDGGGFGSGLDLPGSLLSSAIGGAAPGSVTIGGPDHTGTMYLRSGGFAVNSAVLNLKAGAISSSLTSASAVTVNAGAGTLNLTTNNNGGGIGSTSGWVYYEAGTVTANTTGGGSAYLGRTSDIVIGTSNVGSGTLFLGTSGGVTQSGPLTAGWLSLGTTGNVTLDNAANSIGGVGGTVGDTGRLLKVVSTSGVQLDSLVMNGDLNISAGGDIASIGTWGIRVAGTTTLDAGSHDVNLAYSGHLVGAVSATARNLSFNNDVATILGATQLSGDFNLTSHGDVTQTAALAVSGTTTINSGNFITLTNPSNSLVGQVRLSADSYAAVATTGDLHLGSSSVMDTFTAIAGAGGGTPGAGDLYIDSGATIYSRHADIASPNSVVLIVGDGTSRFVNNAGAGAIKLQYGLPSTSRWLVYTNDPYRNNDVLGGLASHNEAVFATHYTGHDGTGYGSTEVAPSAIAATGNRYVVKTQATGDANYGIVGYDPNKVTITAVAAGKTYGDALTVSTADNSIIVYGTGSMSFPEFSELKPAWLGVAGLTLASDGAAAMAHAGTYDVTATGNLAVNGVPQSIGTLSPSGTTNWSYNDGTHFVTLNDSARIAVTPRILTASVAVDGSGNPIGAVADKVYDGTRTATFSVQPVITLGNIVNGDAVGIDSGGVVGQFTDKNVGTGKVVTLNGLVLANNTYGDYVLPDTLPTYTGDITARPITIAATGVNKQYDATDTATVTLAPSASYAPGSGTNGYINGDLLSYSYTGAIFDAGKDVGTSKAVSVSGIAIGGADVNNYVLTADTASATATIVKRSLALASLTGSKEYDGTTALASATFGVDTANVLGSDVVTGATGGATFDTRHAGIGKTLSADLSTLTLTGADAGNYDLGSGSFIGSGDITAKAVTLTVGNVSKTYDGSTSYTAKAGDLASLSSQLGVAGDAVSAATINYADRNAGAGNKTVALDSVTVADGNGGNNYAITLAGNNTSTIDKAFVTVSTGNVAKPYDGTPAAPGSGTVVSGLLYGGDTLDASSLTFAFADKNAGDNKRVVVGGSAAVNDGNGGGNYTVTLADNTASSIAKARLTVTASSVTKPYDGTTVAGGSATVGALDGAGDAVATAAVQRFLDKNAGTGKTVRASGLVIRDGSNADMTGNYDITYVDDTTGSISPRTLHASFAANSKVYDGTTAATVAVSDDRVGGDALVIAHTAAFADLAVGIGKPVNISGISLSGTDAGNYTLASTVGNTQADITSPALFIPPSTTSTASSGTPGSTGDTGSQFDPAPVFSGGPGSSDTNDNTVSGSSGNQGNEKDVGNAGGAGGLLAGLDSSGSDKQESKDDNIAPLDTGDSGSSSSTGNGQTSTNEAGAGGSDTNGNTVSGTLGNQGNDKDVGNAGGERSDGGKSKSGGGEKSTDKGGKSDGQKSSGGDKSNDDGYKSPNGQTSTNEAGAGGSDANGNTVSGTLGNQGNDKDVGNAGGERPDGGKSDDQRSVGGDKSNDDGNQSPNGQASTNEAGAGGSDTNSNTVSGTLGNQGNGKDVGNAGGERSDGGKSKSGGDSAEGDGQSPAKQSNADNSDDQKSEGGNRSNDDGNQSPNGQASTNEAGAGGSDANSNTVSGTLGNQGNGKDVGNAGGERSDGGDSAEGEGQAPAKQSRAGNSDGYKSPNGQTSTNEAGAGGSDANGNTVSGTLGNQGNGKDVGNAGGERSDGGKSKSGGGDSAEGEGQSPAKQSDAGNSDDQKSSGGDKSSSGAGAGGSDTNGNTVSGTLGNQDNGKDVGNAGGERSDGGNSDDRPSADGNKSNDDGNQSSSGAGAGGSDANGNTVSGTLGNQGNGNAGGEKSDGRGKADVSAKAPAGGPAASGGAKSDDADIGNRGGAGEPASRDRGLLDLGGERGAQAVQFVTGGDSTTLTFTAGAGSDTGDKPGLVGGTNETAKQSTAILLFTQRGATVTPGGALTVVEQGQTLKASSASAEVTSVPALNPATMRFVSVDYRLPTGAQNPVTVGVSPDGVLVVKVSEATKAVMDDRSIALLGLAIARDRLDVKPGNVKGVVIQVDNGGDGGRGLSLSLGNGERVVDVAVAGLNIEVGGGSVAIALPGGAGASAGVASVAMPVVALGAKGELDLQAGIVATEAAGNISFENAEGMLGRTLEAPGAVRQRIAFSIDERGGRSAPFAAAVTDKGVLIRPQGELGRQLLAAQRDLVIGVAIAEVRAKLGVPLAGLGAIYLDLPGRL